MSDEQRRASPLAIWFVIVGLALSALGIVYMVYSGRERQLPALSPTGSQHDPAEVEALLRMLTHSFFILLVFLLGSYVMIRTGRRILTRPPEHRSKYVDAWANYRLSDDEVEEAGRQLREEFPTDGSPDRPPNEESP